MRSVLGHSESLPVAGADLGPPRAQHCRADLLGLSDAGETEHGRTGL